MKKSEHIRSAIWHVHAIVGLPTNITCDHLRRAVEHLTEALGENGERPKTVVRALEEIAEAEEAREREGVAERFGCPWKVGDRVKEAPHMPMRRETLGTIVRFSIEGRAMVCFDGDDPKWGLREYHESNLILAASSGRHALATPDVCGIVSPRHDNVWCAMEPGHEGAHGGGRWYRSEFSVPCVTPEPKLEPGSVADINARMLASNTYECSIGGRTFTVGVDLANGKDWTPDVDRLAAAYHAHAHGEPAADAEKVNRELGRIGAMLSALTPCCNKVPSFRETKQGIDVFECACRLVYTAGQLERTAATDWCCREHVPVEAKPVAGWESLPERCGSRGRFP